MPSSRRTSSRDLPSSAGRGAGNARKSEVRIKKEARRQIGRFSRWEKAETVILGDWGVMGRDKFTLFERPP